MATLDINEKAASHPSSKVVVHTHSSDDDNISPAASSSELDDSYEIYKQGRGVVIDAADAALVRRKIDWHVMPVLLVTYGLNYLDKNSISFASVYGLQAGTHLVGQDYSWLSKKDIDCVFF